MTLDHPGVNKPRTTPLQLPPPAGEGLKSPPVSGGVEGGVPAAYLRLRVLEPQAYKYHETIR
jgi:hypothetical protein